MVSSLCPHAEQDSVFVPHQELFSCLQHQSSSAFVSLRQSSSQMLDSGYGSVSAEQLLKAPIKTCF